MEKFPFTDQGAADLLSALYNLSQTDLQSAANAAGTNFRSWIVAHFELQQSQIDYLDGVDEQWISQAALETKTFLEQRKPITLHKMPAPSVKTEDGDRGKLLDLDKKKTASYSEQEGYQEQETLTFGISYAE